MQSEYSAKRLYAASCVALLVIGMSFSIRSDIITPLGQQFALSHEQLGWIAGAAFWGYTACIFIGGPLCDVVGMGRLLSGACVAHIAGILLTIFAAGFWELWAATLIMGIANALLEAAINPLVATIYPTQKSERLNRVHAWFPWGIVSGGVAAFLLSRLGLGWQWKMAVILPLTVLYGAMCFGQKFPASERVQRGVSTSAMFRETLRPLFLLWVGCMFLTASTELAPNQWIPSILTNTAGMDGILILVWINGLMALGRMFAGPVVHKLSPLGVLIGAAILSACGLYGLSLAASPATAILAATVYAFGVCYFWPTMLGVTAERFAPGGAWALAVIGGAGNLSVALTLPVMGRIYDIRGPEIALRSAVILPLVLIVIFTAIWWRERSQPSTQSGVMSSLE
ncbi:MAG: MFS transporter [Bryobacteraceae bacterium]